MKFTHWADHEPNTEANDEHCVHMLNDKYDKGKWYDYECENEDQGLCEITLDSDTEKGMQNIGVMYKMMNTFSSHNAHIYIIVILFVAMSAVFKQTLQFQSIERDE
ncbi:hypothetical protein B4U80_14675 [Leptotrombidium deliense]|uniref:C-type lectin domain-containing protein n=1 Tax=Leptotrombidium deliense TaxID=299467 RepID=A0A443RSB6_9ACAR|nr:hypothetical protein B4U80_14675 [Leptotrombidium deliense]